MLFSPQQTALQFSAEIAKCYANYQDATSQLSLHKTLIEIHLSEIEADLYFLQNNFTKFTEGVQDRLVDILRELIKNYREVSETFSYARGPDGKIRRGVWVLKLKDTLDTLVKDIEEWQGRFLKYIQCLHFTGFGFKETSIVPVETIRKAPSSKAQRLGISLNKAREEINTKSNRLCLKSLPVPDKNLVDIPLSFLRTPDQDALRKDFVVEYRRYTRSDDPEYLESIVRYTALILAASEPREMYVLCCEGYVHQPELRQFQTILKFPTGMGSPRTLRDLLLDPDPDGEPSLTARVLLSKQIATAALYTHTASLVHKAIRPEAILLLQELDAKQKYKTSKLGTPFLTGFGQARQETPDTYSSLRTNLDWEQDLYSHPSRQGQPTARYTMAHDIYSIGVILLEIGLWRSFIKWNDIKEEFSIDEHVLQDGKTIVRRMKERRPRAGEDLKKLYQSIAEQELPCVMGESFCKVVLRCLNIVEEGLGEGEVWENGAGGVDEGHKEQTVGLKYIRAVLDGLEGIHI